MTLLSTSIEQQIQILKRRRLILPPNVSDILTQYGYYNLINGYKDLFLDRETTLAAGEDMYYPETKLEYLISLYMFDFNLRSNLFRSTSYIETYMKSLISLNFSRKYGSSKSIYLSENSYRDKGKHVQSLIKKLHEDIHYFSHRKPHPSIIHSLKKYNDVPIWILNTIISFGTMSKMYDVLDDDLKKRIAKAVHPKLTPKNLSSMLYFLTDIRNKCAHNNRTFSHRIDQKAMRIHRLGQLARHEALGIPKNSDGLYVYGQDDILAAFIIFSVFFEKAQLFSINYTVLNAHLQELEKNVSPDILVSVREITGLKTEYLKKLDEISCRT